MKMFSWKNDQLLLWLKNSDYSDDVVEAFRCHNITGLTLPFLNSEELKEIGINDLRLRLNLLKDIDSLLIEKNSTFLNINNEHPIVIELQSTVIATNIIKNVSKSISNDTITNLENKNILNQFNKLKEELLPVLKEMQDKKPLPPPIDSSPVRTRVKSISNMGNNKSLRSSFINSNESESLSNIENKSNTVKTSTRPDLIASQSSTSLKPTRFTRSTSSNSLTQSKQKNFTSTVKHSASSSSKASTPTLVSSSSNPSSEPLKQLRAKTEDPCYKILQAAMKSHKLNKNDWKNYALVICYGGDQERVLAYDEKPVVVFRELNEMGLNPSMMLRQVEDEDELDYSQYDTDTPGGRL